MKITVIGCGRWGSLITWYLDKIGNDVTLFGREGSRNMERFLRERKNNLLTLPNSIKLSTNLDSIKESEVIIISVNSQGLRGLMETVAKYNLSGKTFVLCMKGLEIGTGKRLSEVAFEYVGENNNIAVWIGPGHVQEFYRGIPNCMVIDSEDEETKKRLVEAFSGELIRFYYGQDLLGNEIGAATKNVIGIAAGILDGMGLSTLKGALMSRGTREVARLIKVMGGNELSAYGLCHLGDYEATVFSEFSHNRKFGEEFAKGKSFEKLAEGYYTVKALMDLKEKYNVELPICESIYGALYEDLDIKAGIKSLFHRSLKNEIY